PADNLPGSGGYVIGNLQRSIASNSTRRFDVGTSGGAAPVTVSYGTVSGGTPTATIKANTGLDTHIGSSTLSSTKAVNTFWNYTPSGFTTTSFGAVFGWVPALLIGSPNTSNFKVGRWDGAWTYPAVTSPSATSITASSIVHGTPLEFQVAEDTSD